MSPSHPCQTLSFTLAFCLQIAIVCLIGPMIIYWLLPTGCKHSWLYYLMTCLGLISALLQSLYCGHIQNVVVDIATDYIKVCVGRQIAFPRDQLLDMVDAQVTACYGKQFSSCLRGKHALHICHVIIISPPAHHHGMMRLQNTSSFLPQVHDIPTQQALNCKKELIMSVCERYLLLII